MNLTHRISYNQFYWWWSQTGLHWDGAESTYWIQTWPQITKKHEISAACTLFLLHNIFPPYQKYSKTFGNPKFLNLKIYNLTSLIVCLFFWLGENIHIMRWSIILIFLFFDCDMTLDYNKVFSLFRRVRQRSGKILKKNKIFFVFLTTVSCFKNLVINIFN